MNYPQKPFLPITDPVRLDNLSLNILRDFLMTLNGLTDFDLQNRYKNKLPFVHVPDELMEQCNSVRDQI